MKRFLMLVGVACSALAGSPSDAAADDTLCVGALPPGVYDNIVVPSGQTCFLVGVTAMGSVKALEDSFLSVSNGTVVHGNVTGDKAEAVHLVSAQVRGDVEIKDGEIPNGQDARCIGSIIEGNFKIEKMRGAIFVILCQIGGNLEIFENQPSGPDPFRFHIQSNVIGQNLQVFKNSGPAQKFVNGNTVLQSVQCKENDPPFIGGPNMSPNKEGQCF